MSIRANGIACPHCGGATRVMDSRRVVPTMRTMRLQCRNVECGATYGAELAITHIISPPAIVNPAVALRCAPPRRRVANDDAPRAANDRGSEVPPPANENDPAAAAKRG